MKKQLIQLECKAGSVNSVILPVMIGAALSLLVGGASNHALADAVLFEQGFELNTDGWIPFGGAVVRVPSGTNGITSAAGGFHAEATINTGSGIFTRFGQYRGTWPGFIIQSLDVYVDPAAGSVGDGWWLDNAISCSAYARVNYAAEGLTNCNPAVGGSLGWLEAGGVGAKKVLCGGTTPGWAIAADGDGAGNSSGGGVCITTAGWYTIVSEWVESAANTGDDATDTIDRNTYVLDSSGTQIYSNFNVGQHFLRNAGGNRYGWLNSGGSVAARFAGPLPIDNAMLVVAPPSRLVACNQIDNTLSQIPSGDGVSPVTDDEVGPGGWRFNKDGQSFVTFSYHLNAAEDGYDVVAGRSNVGDNTGIVNDYPLVLDLPQDPLVGVETFKKKHGVIVLTGGAPVFELPGKDDGSVRINMTDSDGDGIFEGCAKGPLLVNSGFLKPEGPGNFGFIEKEYYKAYAETDDSGTVTFFEWTEVSTFKNTNPGGN